MGLHAVSGSTCFATTFCRGARRILLGIAGLTVFSLGLGASIANAGFILGTAGNYAILVEPGASSYQLNNSTINGTVGIGANIGGAGGNPARIQIASNGFIKDAIAGQPTTGQLLIVDNLNVAAISNTANVQGGVFANQPQVTTAINTVNSLNTTLGAEAGTALTISGGGQMVNVASGMLDPSGNRVFTIAGNAFNNNNQGFTVVGSATDFVVFNINNGVSNESFGGPISLSGGIDPNHVLFNFVGTSGNLNASAGGATINGTILVPNMAVNLDNMTLNGHLFGGRPGADFQVVSGFKLNGTLIPEPSTIVLAGLGLCAAFVARQRIQAR
jgi:hypothetical protein